jgi:hypothetical protein
MRGPRNELTNFSIRLSRNVISKDAVIRLITNQTITINVPINLYRSSMVVSFVDQKDCFFGYSFSRAILALNLKRIRYPRLSFCHWGYGDTLLNPPIDLASMHDRMRS